MSVSLAAASVSMNEAAPSTVFAEERCKGQQVQKCVFDFATKVFWFRVFQRQDSQRCVAANG